MLTQLFYHSYRLGKITQEKVISFESKLPETPKQLEQSHPYRENRKPPPLSEFTSNKQYTRRSAFYETSNCAAVAPPPRRGESTRSDVSGGTTSHTLHKHHINPHTYHTCTHRQETSTESKNTWLKTSPEHNKTETNDQHQHAYTYFPPVCESTSGPPNTSISKGADREEKP